jgi:hypothetical protein
VAVGMFIQILINVNNIKAPASDIVIDLIVAYVIDNAFDKVLSRWCRVIARGWRIGNQY